MIKRILTLILTLAMLGTMWAGISVSAAAVTSASVLNEPGLGAVTISGTVAANRANTVVVFRLIDDLSGDEVYMDFTTTYKEDGVVKFDFGTILLPPALPSGDYTALISGEDIAEEIEEPYVFASPSEMVTLLAAIKTATETEGASVGDVLNTGKNAKIVGIDINDYNIIAAETNGNPVNPDGLAEFEHIMKAVEYQTVASADDVEGIGRESARVKGAYRDAVAGALIIMADNGSDVQTWYNRFYADLGFNTEAAPDNQKVTPILTSVKDTDDFAARIVKLDGKKTVAEIKDYMYECAILSAIVDMTDSKVKALFENFSDIYFKGDSFEIAWDEFNRLGDIDKASVISTITGKSFATCKAAVEELNLQIDMKRNPNKYKDDDNGGSSSGGSGGGGGRGQTAYLPAIEPVEEKDIFVDLKDAEWAREAIEYLYNAKVVNGNPDGSFAPDNNVTRAEFIKMVIAAMGIGDIEGTNPFEDVKAGEWYTPYIKRAYNTGLTQGDGSGNFYPNSPITREDMAVILYRALNINEKGKLSFTDANLISDYAKDAVGYFATQGIVNGYADGSFGPLNNATRAETATIIYRIMTSK